MLLFEVCSFRYPVRAVVSHLCSDKGPCPPLTKCERLGGPRVYKRPPSTSGWLSDHRFTCTLWLMDFLRACVLCAALCALVEAFTHQDMKAALLEKLGLDELPKTRKRDLENLVIPAHIRNKYLSMLKTHHSRRRRSLPSLAGILRGIPGNAGEDSLHFNH